MNLRILCHMMLSFLQKKIIDIFDQKIFRISLGSSGIFFILIAGIIISHYTTLTTPIVLHFDALRGITLFGNPFDLWLSFFMFLFFIVFNTILAKAFFYRERILAYLLLGINPLLALLTLISIAFVISIN